MVSTGEDGEEEETFNLREQLQQAQWEEKQRAERTQRQLHSPIENVYHELVLALSTSEKVLSMVQGQWKTQKTSETKTSNVSLKDLKNLKDQLEDLKKENGKSLELEIKQWLPKQILYHRSYFSNDITGYGWYQLASEMHRSSDQGNVRMSFQSGLLVLHPIRDLKKNEEIVILERGGLTANENKSTLHLVNWNTQKMEIIDLLLKDLQEQKQITPQEYQLQRSAWDSLQKEYQKIPPLESKRVDVWKPYLDRLKPWIKIIWKWCFRLDQIAQTSLDPKFKWKSQFLFQCVQCVFIPIIFKCGFQLLGLNPLHDFPKPNRPDDHPLLHPESLDMSPKKNVVDATDPFIQQANWKIYLSLLYYFQNYEIVQTPIPVQEKIPIHSGLFVERKASIHQLPLQQLIFLEWITFEHKLNTYDEFPNVYELLVEDESVPFLGTVWFGPEYQTPSQITLSSDEKQFLSIYKTPIRTLYKQLYEIMSQTHVEASEKREKEFLRQPKK